MNKNHSPEFSYLYYKQILSLIKKNFEAYLFSQAPQVLKYKHDKSIIFLRHDVDLDIEKARIMANIENENGISSCYMVMTKCPFYSLQDDSTKFFLKDLIQMGHEIGLHSDFTNSIGSERNKVIDDIEKHISNECDLLENIISRKVNSISFHRPLQQFLRGTLYIAGKINAYSSELMNCYLSDSKGVWRVGDPVQFLENTKETILQLLIHPIWWSDDHQSPSDILQSFFEYKTQNFSQEMRMKFDDAMSSHLSIYRTKKEE